MNADERKFVFRLESLRRLRERQRDECRQTLALVERDEDAILGRQSELERQRKEIVQQARDATGPGIVDLGQLIATRDYRQALAAEHATLVEQRRALSGEIERQRETTLAAERQTRMLEILSDKQRLRHHEQNRRVEARRFDETLACVPLAPPVPS